MKRLSLLTILLCAASLKADHVTEVQAKLDAHKANHARLHQDLEAIKAEIEQLLAEVRKLSGDHKHADTVRAHTNRIKELEKRQNHVVDQIAAEHEANAKTRLAVNENHVQITHDGKAQPVVHENKKPAAIVHEKPKAYEHAAAVTGHIVR